MRRMWCAQAQQSILVSVAITFFEQTKRIPQIMLAAIQPASRWTIVCERFMDKSGNVRCCLEVRGLCLLAACHDRRLAASESMLIVQTTSDVSLRWSVHMPPSRGRAWRLSVGARVSATLQFFTPEWFLMPQLVDWGSLEMCMMYWVFSELIMLYRLCCVFLCRGRRKSEWGSEATMDETCYRPDD